MDRGKRLEEKFKKFLKKEGYYFHRFYDARSGVNVSQPADFFVYHNHQLYYFECKESKKSSIPITAFRPRQLKEARDAPIYGIEYWAVVDFNGEILCFKPENYFKNKTIKPDWTMIPFDNIQKCILKGKDI